MTSHVHWRTPQRPNSSHLDLQSSIQYLGVPIIFEGARASRHSSSSSSSSSSGSSGSSGSGSGSSTILRPFVRLIWVSRHHSHISWSSIILYLLLSSTMIHSILPVQFMCMTVFLHNLCPSLLVYLLFCHFYCVNLIFLFVWKCFLCAFSTLMLLIGWQVGHLACQNWVVRYWHVICLEQGANDLVCIQSSWCCCHSFMSLLH